MGRGGGGKGASSPVTTSARSLARAHDQILTTFIRHPGLSGPFGALMDEYARAAEDFCRVVEGFDVARFDVERPSNNPNTVSPRAICLHVIGAAHRYAHYIRKTRGVDFVERDRRSLCGLSAGGPAAVRSQRLEARG